MVWMSQRDTGYTVCEASTASGTTGYIPASWTAPDWGGGNSPSPRIAFIIIHAAEVDNLVPLVCAWYCRRSLPGRVEFRTWLPVACADRLMADVPSGTCYPPDVVHIGIEVPKFTTGSRACHALLTQEACVLTQPSGLKDHSRGQRPRNGPDKFMHPGGRAGHACVTRTVRYV